MKPTQPDASSAKEGASSTPIEPRQTKQRDTISRLIETSDGPLSVPEIHDRARATLPGIGIATVYRTLKLLHELRQVQPVILPSGETRYERTGIGHHEHFQCRGCSQVFDLDVCPVHIPRGTKLPGGFLVEDHVMTIYGLCSACQVAGS